MHCLALRRLDMEKRNGLSFNCAESVILQTNDVSPLPGFGLCHMRVGSVLGGGIAGRGEVCGAVTGAVVCLGLTFGSEGTESETGFKSKRTHARGLVNRFMDDFECAWGSVECRTLRAIDKGEAPRLGDLRPDGPPTDLCDEYVRWSTARVSEIISKEAAESNIEVH
jgi:C_GCAxxG_C_C family probable redox protein